MKIEGSGALVAGGASGLGEATARRLHGGGARVTVADVNDERGQALADELGERASFVHADVRNEDEVSAAATQAARAEGGLRICICCAGTGWAQKIAGSRGPHDLLPFETIIGINLIGTFNVLRFAASAMLANGPLGDSNERGVCVNTASAAAYEGQIGQVAYSASKGGVVGMTLPAARDLADKGIRVMTIAPGLFDTQLRQDRAVPASAGPAGRVRAARLRHRRERDAQRRGHPARRGAADGAALARGLGAGLNPCVELGASSAQPP
jgi:3-hydroxyacyl-CoA dehydrogenase/3-hydroxy-2-methylbutyryl-CoA dehydrogenase